MIVDRYSGWPIVTPAAKGATGLANVLRETFASYGIPDTITTDGGPEFAAHSTRELLANWGVRHRLCSAYNPHSNNRAETAVKSMKRLIAGNTGPGGTLTSPFFKAILAYRNTPAPDTKMSPASLVLGRPIRDLLPTLQANLQPPPHTSEGRRRAAMDKRKSTAQSRWSEHTSGLTPLKRGDAVYVQNKHGNHPGKWDHTGTVVEVLQYHQYTVRMDGNGRLTTRNRQHLRRNPNPTRTPETSLRARMDAAPPRHTPPPAAAPSPLPPTPPLATPRPTTPTQPRTGNPTPGRQQTSQPTPARHTPISPTPTLAPPTTPVATTPTYHQPPRKLQFPPTNNPAGPQTYASVAGSPPPIRPPKPPTSPRTSRKNPPTQPTTQPPPSRWSKRTKKPPDRYGH